MKWLESPKVRKSEVRKSGSPEVQKSASLEVREDREVRKSGKTGKSGKTKKSKRGEVRKSDRKLIARHQLSFYQVFISHLNYAKTKDDK